MSDTPTPDNQPPQRATSVRLREQAPATARHDVSQRMDAANQALHDALRITYRLVQLAMVVLVLLFLGSGFRTIQEGQRGLSTRFGKLVNTNLEPGPQFAWPYPVGEVVAVGTGTNELRLETSRDFFPYVHNQIWSIGETDLPKENQLDPAKDGSLITADLNIAHAQWTVNFRRDRHAQFATNILPDQEQEIVRSCVRRGIVHAVAEVPIDNFLKDRDTTAGRAMGIAQAALDELDSGIRIEQLSLNRKFPPVQLLERFEAVSSEAQSAGEARAKARTGAQNLLSGVAGQAAGPLVALIDAYEQAIELGEVDRATEALAAIDAVLDGRQASFDDLSYDAGLVSGEVSETLARASNKRIAQVADASADLKLFEAKAAQFNASPGLMLTREWASSMEALLNKPFVQVFAMRAGDTDAIDVWINEDPDIRRAQEMEQKRQQTVDAQSRRDQARRAARYQVDEGLKKPEEEGP